MKVDKAKKLKKIISKAPDKAGIYKMLDKDNTVIYIGKANSIRKRLNQYLQKNYSHSSRTEILLKNLENIEYIEVEKNIEAIILEHNLIKELKPKYNVVMKDDKSFVYIKITKEDFPRIEIVRKVEKDNAVYIGPKTSTQKVKNTLKILKTIFPYRHCSLNIKQLEENKVEVSNKVIKYPCLDYHIKKCTAPCIGKITPEEYKKIVEKILKFLNGKSEEILIDLKVQMQNFAKNKNFEKAAILRDKIKGIHEILEKQIVSTPNKEDTDIINYLINDQKAYFNLFQIRNGHLTGQENFILSTKLEDDDKVSKEVIEMFLKDYYSITSDLPSQILIPHKTTDLEEIKIFIKETSNKNIKITTPQKGENKKLLELSLNNAKIFADRNKESWKNESKKNQNALKLLEKSLKIKNLKRIECYDISHFGGTNTVSSMVVFENGAPNFTNYRKFKLKTIENKIDDYKSLEETLRRRLSYIGEKIHISKIKNSTNFKITKSNKAFDLTTNKLEENIFLIEEINEKLLSDLKKILFQVSLKLKAKKIYIKSKNKDKDIILLAGLIEPKIQNELISKLKKEESIFCFISNKNKIDKSFTKTPDLIIIDGGKGQLSAVQKVFIEKNLKIPTISLAKKEETIFISQNLNKKISPLILNKNNEALKLLQRIRDEAHRFAISYQKKLRSFK